MNDILFYGVPAALAIYAIRMRFFKTVYLLFAVIFGVYFGLYWSFPASLVTILDDRMLVNYKKVITVGVTGFSVFFLLNRIFYNSLASRKLFDFPHTPDKIFGAICGYLAGSAAVNFVVFVFTMTPFTDTQTTFSADLLRNNSLKSMERVTKIVNYASLQKFDLEKCEKYLISLRPAPPEPPAEAQNNPPATPAGTGSGEATAPTGTGSTGTGTGTTTPNRPKPATTTPTQPTPRDGNVQLKTQPRDTNIQLKTQPRTKVDLKI